MAEETLRAGLKKAVPVANPSQHRTKALNKLVIISSTAVAAVRVKMEFQLISLP